MFDPLEFLRFAEALTIPPLMSESGARNAVSRAYYAVFLFARERLVHSGLMQRVGGAGEHGRVAQLLRAQANPTGQAAAHQLDILRRARNLADYDLEWEPDRLAALRATQAARMLVAYVQRVLPEAP